MVCLYGFSLFGIFLVLFSFWSAGCGLVSVLVFDSLLLNFAFLLVVLALWGLFFGVSLIFLCCCLSLLFVT